MNNKKLRLAKEKRDDEWYTQYKDVEKEFNHYWDVLKNKIIYCNCDDPEKSNFYLYFKDNFKKIGLKGLYATFYGCPFSTFYDGEKEMKESFLLSDGDFRSEECIAIMRKSDVVITNPPFSLLLAFHALLIEEKKDYAIIIPTTSIMYQGIIKEIVGERLFMGFMRDKCLKFIRPDGSMNEMNCCSITSFNISQDDFVFERKYSDMEYEVFDNYDAINVKKLRDIPMDYYGLMGVPQTFLAHYDPTKFKIVGVSNAILRDFFHFYPSKNYHKIGLHYNNTITKICNTLSCSVIKDNTMKDKYYQEENGTDRYRSTFVRIFIKRI